MKLLPAVLVVSLLSLAVTSDVVDLDYPWITAIANRNHGYALVGHVIKTLSLFLPDCIAACQETLNCFSINYADYKNGTFICELNRSNKRRNETSYVPKQHYQYLENKKYCEGIVCIRREALEQGWYKFNHSKFKLFYNKMSWDSAQTYCQTIGGNLASIHSATERRFIEEVVLFPQFLINNDFISFYNGAKTDIIDDRTTVEFDGVDDYATTPSVNFRTIDFTIAFWIKPRANSFSNLFNGKKGSLRQFSFFIYDGKMRFKFYNVNKEVLINDLNFPKSDMPLNQWTHVALTWDRKNKTFKLYVNGVLKKNMVTSLANVDLFNTGQPTFQVGAIGGTRYFNGFLSDLVILPGAMNQEELIMLKDGLFYGPWIGLNDKIQENNFQWSDGTPLSYALDVTANGDILDCVQLRKIGNFKTQLAARISNEQYTREFTFICKKF